MIYQDISDYRRAPAAVKCVFTNGCFDILHKGHLTYLKQAKYLGDSLIIGLNSDTSVKKLKGESRPINTWEKRAKALADLDFVDTIIGFSEDTPLQLIKSLRPDVIVKGGDYHVDQMIGKDYVESYGGRVLILPYVEGYSTTDIIDKMSR